MAYRRHRHPFTQQTTVTIPARIHGLDTAQMLTEVFLTGQPYWGRCRFEVQIDPQTADVCVQFCHTDWREGEPILVWDPPQSGVIVLHAWSPSEAPLSP
jgi:hypothetical protein